MAIPPIPPIPIGGLLRKDGTTPLTGNWDAGSFEIRAQTLESDVATGTAPLTIASTTVNTNLNADLLDGLHDTDFAKTTSAGTITVGADKDYATIQGAIDSIEGVVTGNIIINIDAGTYREQVVIQGKNYSGNYTITLKGTYTATVSGTSTGSNANTSLGGTSTLKDTGKSWTTDAYKGYLVKITGGTGSGQIQPIYGNTATQLNIVGLWDTIPDNTSTYDIFQPSVRITGSDAGADTTPVRNYGVWIKGGQKGIILDTLKLDYCVKYGVYCYGQSEGTLQNCYSTGHSSAGARIELGSILTVTRSSFEQTTGVMCLWNFNSSMLIMTWVYVRSSVTWGMVNATMVFSSIQDCYFTGGTTGIVRVNAIARVDTSRSTYRDGAVGFKVQAGGMLELTNGGLGGVISHYVVITANTSHGIQGMSAMIGTNTPLTADDSITNNGGWGVSVTQQTWAAVSAATYSGNVSGTYTADAATFANAT